MRRHALGLVWLCALLTGAGAEGAPITGLSYFSSPNSWVGQGESVLVTPQGGFEVRPIDEANGIGFSINDFATNPDFASQRWWDLRLAGPNFEDPGVGLYAGVPRWPFQPAIVGAFDFFGNGRGANSLSATFNVLEAVYALDGTVLQFAVDFSQYEDNFLDRWVVGSLRYRSSVPLPGLAVPEPSLVWLCGPAAVALLRRRRRAAAASPPSTGSPHDPTTACGPPEG